MKLNYKYLLFLVLFCKSLHAKTFIKVLLERAQNQDTCWVFKSKDSFTLSLPKLLKNGVKSQDSMLVKKDFTNLNIKIINNKIYLNNQLYKFDSLKLNAGNSPIGVNNDLYDGNFIICKYHNEFLLINQVEIEDYITSVLKTESWPGWPIEVNKAFAIASRSYVLAQVLQARRAKLPYHIKNTNHHQTYSGIHGELDIRQAVLETKGIILGHKNEPILAMFDCCCGGVIPAHIEGFDFASHPYLARTKVCTHCRLVKINSWHLSFSKKDFKKIIQAYTPGLGAIKKIDTQTDKAGTVKKIIIHDHQNTYTIDARKMYSLFKDIKSFCYSVYQSNNRIKVHGTGFGHHLGLCQWGAREMIRKGYNHRDILSFYYPGAKFMKFKGYQD
jgi:stage II sporulation protein D